VGDLAQALIELFQSESARARVIGYGTASCTESLLSREMARADIGRYWVPVTTASQLQQVFCRGRNARVSL
jgi:hypothetical protein